MFKAFKERRPWAASLINFVFGPEFGMLYINRGWFAIGYFFCFLGAIPIYLTIFPAGVGHKALDQLWPVYLAFRVVGALHANFVARKKSTQHGIKWYAHWYSVIGLTIVAPGFLALGIRTFLYQSFDIPSASMEPNVNLGDYLFVSKLAYIKSQPQRGDLIVFYAPSFHSYFIKRIIGLPGERVQMVHGRLTLNGVPAAQRPAPDWLEDCGEPQPCRVRQFEETLPNGRTIRILNRESDGLLDNTDVFTVPADSYFVLGDNRDNSNDTRTNLGYVLRSQVTGRAAYRFMAGGRFVWQPLN